VTKILRKNVTVKVLNSDEKTLKVNVEKMLKRKHGKEKRGGKNRRWQSE
jgi:hypothetical protein